MPKSILVCWKCAKENNLVHEYQNSVLHVLSGQGGSTCYFCKEDNGGADIKLKEGVRVF